MCGIAGFFSPGKGSGDFYEIVENMLLRILHRGPDEAGFYMDDSVAMATARLSIIDLQSGSQPLGDSTGRYWICYNGELYNYLELRVILEEEGCVFQTASDTEVVLQAYIHWGVGALQRFNGAFGFAIWDNKEERLFLARDRFGKRPLFYVRHDGGFYFASEMKSFLEIPGFSFVFDTEQLASTFTLWTPLPEQSCFKDIHQIPVGGYIFVDRDGEKSGTYYHLNFAAEPYVKPLDEAAEDVRNALIKSVDLRLRSDVEVAIYLSGGLDSVIVTDLVTSGNSKGVHTFSVEFEDQSFDESDHQKLAAEFYGTKHSAVRITSQDIVNTLPDALYHAEIPVFRTAFVPMFLLSQMVHDAGIKVVLSGEGADESFLGYNIFKETLLRGEWPALDNETRQRKLASIYPYLKHFSEENLPHLVGVYTQFSEERTPGLFSHELRTQHGVFINRLLADKHDPLQAVTALMGAADYYETLGPVQKAQWLEFKTLLGGYLLSTQGERMGLAHAVENRCPFLDPDVVALSSAVNLQYDDGFNEKFILKKAFEGRLPEAILNKPKFPYRAPNVAAFSQHRPDYLDLLLSSEELENMEFMNAKFCGLLANKVLNADPESLSVKENSAFMFMVSTALVHRQFVMRQGLPALDRRYFERMPVKFVDRRRGAA